MSLEYMGMGNFKNKNTVVSVVLLLLLLCLSSNLTCSNKQVFNFFPSQVGGERS